MASCVQSKNGTLEFEVYTCTEPSSTSTNSLLLKGDNLTTAFQTFSAYFEVTATTGKYIGFKNISKGNYRFFYLDDISVKEINPAVPAPATAFTATAGTGKTVNVSLAAPSVTIMNKPLQALKSVKLLRNGEQVHQWDNPAPGETLTFTDVVSLVGEYTYTAIGEVESGAGDPATATATVGGTTSLDPTTWGGYDKTHGNNPKAETTYVPGSGVKLTWEPYDAGEGVEVTYTVTRLADNKIIADHVSDCEATDPEALTATPAIYTYKVTAHYDGTDKELYTSGTASVHNTMPFIANIDKAAINEFTSFDLFCIQNNGTYGPEGSRWVFSSNVSANYHDGITKAFTTYVADDWLISPGVDLKAGKTYRIDIDLFSNNIIPKNFTFELKNGDTNTVEGMTNTLIETTTADHMSPVTYSAFYTPTSDEHKFFGLHTYDSKGEKTYDYVAISAYSIKEVPGGLPTAATDIKVTFSASDPTKAILSLVAPTTDVTGATLSSLTKIEVLKDGAPFHTFTSPAPGETLTLDINVQLGTMSVYTITPYSEAGEGLSSRTEVFIIEPPYENAFNSKDDLTGFTVINPDATGYTWSFQGQAARAFPSSNYGHDDYLVTPPIHLEGGQYYKLSFTSWLDRAQGEPANDIEVLLGTSPTIEGLTTKVLEPYTVSGAGTSNAVLLKEYFTVPTTGEYYLAWHAKAEATYATELYIDNVTLSDKIDPTVPNMATDLVITPDPEGELAGTVAFNLPVIDLAGNPLDYTIYKYEVYRDGSIIASGWPKAGETSYTVTDKNMTEGMHLYSVICYKANNAPGREKEDIAWFGFNLPAAVPYVEASETEGNYGQVTLKWEAPTTDVIGFKLNTSNITYTVGRLNVSMYTGEITEEVYETGYTGTTLTVQAMTAQDRQEFCRFFVRPATPKGNATSTRISNWIAVGTPYEMPVNESFANSRVSLTVMQTTTGDGSPTQWGFNTKNPVTGVEAVDGDDGLALMEVMFSGGGARLMTGRVHLTGEHPTLYMWLYNQSTADRTDSNRLAIETREGSGDFVAVAEHTIDEWTGSHPGWQKVAVDLTPLSGKVVYLGFNGTSDRYTFIHVDNITIEEGHAQDLTLHTISVPEVYVGVDHTISAGISNIGLNDATGAAIDLLLDGNVVATRNDITLAPGASTTVTFDNLLGREALGEHTYSAVVRHENDADLLDNTAKAPAFVLYDNDFPTVVNLDATQDGSAVSLKWEEPIIPNKPQAVTEDFLSYNPWSTMHTSGGIGQWTLIDSDALGVGGFQNWEMPNVALGSTQSFFIMDFSNSHFASDLSYRAHSGSQCAVSMYATEGYVDDHLISPLLCGEEQTLTFWAKGLSDNYKESFTVRYSTGTTRLSDFKELARETVGGTWTRFTYTLPEGTRYFEINHYSYGGYFFFVDDITYTPRGSESLTLSGYNVYRGDEKVNTTPLAEKTWADATPAEGTNTYRVSAVYDRGESPAIEITTGYSAADALAADRISVTTEGSDIVITGVTGSDFVVCNVSGLIMTARTGTGDDRVTVTPGVYLVTTPSGTTKVIVK